MDADRAVGAGGRSMKRFASFFLASSQPALHFKAPDGRPIPAVASEAKSYRIPEGNRLRRKANVALNTWDGQPNHSATTDVEGQFANRRSQTWTIQCGGRASWICSIGRRLRRSISISVLAGQDKTDVVFHMTTRRYDYREDRRRGRRSDEQCWRYSDGSRLTIARRAFP